MDEETKKRIEGLETRIAVLEAIGEHTWNILKENFEKLANSVEENRVSGLDLSAKIWGEVQKLQERGEGSWALHKTAKKLLEFHGERLNGIGLDLARLDEAYYHIFPERLKQDVHLQRQLKALRSKQEPDADPEGA